MLEPVVLAPNIQRYAAYLCPLNAPCSVSYAQSRSSLTGWKVLRHPDSERHVSSYTTLVPVWQGISHSCLERVSGSRAALLLDGCPLLVARLLIAANDGGEVLDNARVAHRCAPRG